MRDRRKKIKRMPYAGSRRGKWAAWILAFFFVLEILAQETLAVQAEPEHPPLPAEIGSLYARSAVLMDADRMRVLAEKEGDVMRPMASTTKILTCILALEEGREEEVVTVSEKAASQPKVHLGMRSGEKFRLKDLLYSLMLESHNDSAVAIAEHLAGSVEKFAEKMNAKAREIGCEHAHFVTPNGLDAADEGGVHSISAADLARIMCYCVAKSPKAEAFLALTQTRSYQFRDAEEKRTFSCNNHNLFLDMMEGAISGKTGFTGDAGYCYVGALERDGRTFAVALLGCGWPNNKNYKWADTRKLMNYGLEHYEYRTIQPTLPLEPVTVEEGVPEDGELFAEAELEADSPERMDFSILLAENERVEEQTELVQKLEAPVAKGDVIGCVRFLLNGSVLEEYPLRANRNVLRKDFAWTLQKMCAKYLKFQLD